MMITSKAALIISLILSLGNYGIAYANNVVWDKEIISIEAELNAKPKNINTLTKGVIAYNNYAQYYFKNKDYKTAAEYFLKAIQIAPAQQYLMKSISNTYYAWAQDVFSNTNDLNQAIALLNKSLTYNGHNSAANILYKQLHDTKTANIMHDPYATAQAPMNFTPPANFTPPMGSMPAKYPYAATLPMPK
jgi:tetratricopeptide (TPR) repeat protein